METLLIRYEKWRKRMLILFDEMTDQKDITVNKANYWGERNKRLRKIAKDFGKKNFNPKELYDLLKEAPGLTFEVIRESEQWLEKVNELINFYDLNLLNLVEKINDKYKKIIVKTKKILVDLKKMKIDLEDNINNELNSQYQAAIRDEKVNIPKIEEKYGEFNK